MAARDAFACSKSTIFDTPPLIKLIVSSMPLRVNAARVNLFVKLDIPLPIPLIDSLASPNEFASSFALVADVFMFLGRELKFSTAIFICCPAIAAEATKDCISLRASANLDWSFDMSALGVIVMSNDVSCFFSSSTFFCNSISLSYFACASKYNIAITWLFSTKLGFCLYLFGKCLKWFFI